MTRPGPNEASSQKTFSPGSGGGTPSGYPKKIKKKKKWVWDGLKSVVLLLCRVLGGRVAVGINFCFTCAGESWEPPSSITGHVCSPASASSYSC